MTVIRYYSRADKIQDSTISARNLEKCDAGRWSFQASAFEDAVSRQRRSLLVMGRILIDAELVERVIIKLIIRDIQSGILFVRDRIEKFSKKTFRV